MLQRIGIAQALVHDPRVVFLDEPMSGLDPVGRKEIRDLILKLRAEGKTVFMNTHILSDVELACDRVAIIARGRIVHEGAIDAFEGGRPLELAGPGIRETIKVAPQGLPDTFVALAAAKRAMFPRGVDLILVEGYIQSSPEEVTHLVAQRLTDRSHDLIGLANDALSARTAMPAGPALVEPLHDDRRQHPDNPAQKIRHPRNVRILPASRDFH